MIAVLLLFGGVAEIITRSRYGIQSILVGIWALYVLYQSAHGTGHWGEIICFRRDPSKRREQRRSIK
jgi:hypothetical protein